MVQLTGAQALIKSLEQEGVDTIFGLPGGAILPVYDPLLDSSIRHILVRHEQGAGHMAEGYALATGRPGVAMVTSGPGATNIVTPIGNAHMDSTPLVVITGQVATAAIGTDAFQECDITGITMGITKHNFLVQSAQEIPRAVAAALGLPSTASTVMSASSGRNSSTGSSRRSVQSSTSVIAQAATTGFVIEAMRQIVSAAIGVLEPAPSKARWPVASTWTSPWRARTATAPGA